MIELEKTYLVKFLPLGWEKCAHKEIIDIYLPKDSEHCKLRIRKNWDKYEITKKGPVNPNDISHQREENIPLDEEEFKALSTIEGKRVHKLRYYYPYEGRIAEIDIFQDDLSGLALVDFEFDSIESKDAFQMPDFCLIEVTQEEFIAGWVLCGKKYEEIENSLSKFNYKKLA